jgi:hypothetical protein
MTKIEYEPEIRIPGGRGEPDRVECPTVSRWRKSTVLVDGQVLLTARHEIVDIIINKLRTAKNQSPDHDFLERITVDGGLVTFDLGS